MEPVIILNIRNRESTSFGTDFRDEDFDDSDNGRNLDTEDFGKWGLESLFVNDLSYKVNETTFWSVANSGDNDTNRFSAGEALFGISTIENIFGDGEADNEINSIGIGVLRDYIKSAKSVYNINEKPTAIEQECYRKALTYLFSGFVDTKLKANNLAEYFINKSANKIAYELGMAKGVITGDKVRNFYSKINDE